MGSCECTLGDWIFYDRHLLRGDYEGRRSTYFAQFDLSENWEIRFLQIHVGGRPPDEFSEGIETSFTGCMARLQLNSVDLLSFAPRDEGHKCQVGRDFVCISNRRNVQQKSETQAAESVTSRVGVSSMVMSFKALQSARLD